MLANWNLCLTVCGSFLKNNANFLNVKSPNKRCYDWQWHEMKHHSKTQKNIPDSYFYFTTELSNVCRKKWTWKIFNKILKFWLWKNSRAFLQLLLPPCRCGVGECRRSRFLKREGQFDLKRSLLFRQTHRLPPILARPWETQNRVKEKKFKSSFTSKSITASFPKYTGSEFT